MTRFALVLGGARSGKSAFAARLAGITSGSVLFVATAEAGDAEMTARIERHRRERPSSWKTIESPLNLVTSLAESASDDETVLVDCASVWLSNELLACAAGFDAVDGVLDSPQAAQSEEVLLRLADDLCSWAENRSGATIVVSNEVGSGVVPAYPLGRLYRDVLGRANQRMAARAGRTFFVVAGIALDLHRLALRDENLRPL